MVSINTAFHFLSAIAFAYLCWQIIKLQSHIRMTAKIHTKNHILLKFNDFIRVFCKTYKIPLLEKSSFNKVLKISPKPWLTLVNNKDIQKIVFSAKPKPSCHIYVNQDKMNASEEQKLIASLNDDIEVKFVPY